MLKLGTVDDDGEHGAHKVGEVIVIGELLMIETLRERLRKLNELLDIMEDTEDRLAEQMEHINAIQQATEA